MLFDQGSLTHRHWGAPRWHWWNRLTRWLMVAPYPWNATERVSHRAPTRGSLAFDPNEPPTSLLGQSGPLYRRCLLDMASCWIASHIPPPQRGGGAGTCTEGDVQTRLSWCHFWCCCDDRPPRCDGCSESASSLLHRGEASFGLWSSWRLPWQLGELPIVSTIRNNTAVSAGYIYIYTYIYIYMHWKLDEHQAYMSHVQGTLCIYIYICVCMYA